MIAKSYIQIFGKLVWPTGRQKKEALDEPAPLI
jgi:hypothetical protein